MRGCGIRSSSPLWIIWPNNSTKRHRVSSRHARTRGGWKSARYTFERRMKHQSVRRFLTRVNATLYLPLVTFVTFATFELGPFLSVSLLYLCVCLSLSLALALSLFLSLSLSPLHYELHRLIPPSPRACRALLLIPKAPKRRDWRLLSGALAVLEDEGENKVKVPENEEDEDDEDDGGFPPARAQEFLISLIRVRRFCIYYWTTHILYTHTHTHTGCTWMCAWHNKISLHFFFFCYKINDLCLVHNVDFDPDGVCVVVVDQLNRR